MERARPRRRVDRRRSFRGNATGNSRDLAVPTQRRSHEDAQDLAAPYRPRALPPRRRARRLGTTVGDGLWLRVVDVAVALEGRAYGVEGTATGRLTLDLRDDYCPWNAGCWSMDVVEGRAR